MKKRKLSTAKANAWKWFSKYVRLKYADSSGWVQCWTCDSTHYWQDLDCGHWIPKKRGNSVYFEERNCRPQCVSCNRFYEGMGHVFTQRMVEEYGPGIVDEMEAQARQTVKFTVADYDAMAEDYRNRVRELEQRVAA